MLLTDWYIDLSSVLQDEHAADGEAANAACNEQAIKKVTETARAMETTPEKREQKTHVFAICPRYDCRLWFMFAVMSFFGAACLVLALLKDKDMLDVDIWVI